MYRFDITLFEQSQLLQNHPFCATLGNTRLGFASLAPGVFLNRRWCLGPFTGARTLAFLDDTTMEKVPMTEAGYNSMIEEVRSLKTVERPRIIRAIEEARAHGDLSENAEYHAAKEAQGWNEARVAELEDKISRADVIDVSKLSGETVMFGAKVTLIDEDTDAKVIYQIVGDMEADVKKGRISISSPIARAIIGKKKGDSVDVNTPGGGKSYEIDKVAWN
jgi:transcription elongation factor GreA